MKKPTYKSLLGMSVQMVYGEKSFDAYVAAVDKDIGITLHVLDRDDPNTRGNCNKDSECLCINIQREKEFPDRYALYKLSARQRMNVVRSMILKGVASMEEYASICEKQNTSEVFSHSTPCAFKKG